MTFCCSKQLNRTLLLSRLQPALNAAQIQTRTVPKHKRTQVRGREGLVVFPSPLPRHALLVAPTPDQAS